MLLKFLLFASVLVMFWRLSRKRSSAPLPERGERPEGAKASDPWQVLGVAPDAGAATIRAAYQEKIQQYHPDKVAALGPELREIAERRTRQINDAYAKLKKSGG